MQPPPPLSRLFDRGLALAVVAERGERRPLAVAFVGAFLIFSSYSVLRPVRDAMGITSGVAHLPALFWGTFAAMLAVQPVFGLLTARSRRAVLLPRVYAFFVLNLLGFWAWFSVQEDHTWIARTYFIWVSVFNLFVVSVFWSLMADTFSREQAGRLFGCIAAGISLGGLFGPLLSLVLVPRIGSINLLLVAAGLLTLSILAIRWLTAYRPPRPIAADDMPDSSLGGNAWSAFREVLASPYILAIAAFVILLTSVGTFLYMEQAVFVDNAFATRDEKTAFFSTVDFWVQLLSLILQAVFFGRLFRWFGFTTLILIVPFTLVLGFAAIAMAPGFAVVVAVVMIRRIGEYGIMRPCREMLWTGVDRQEKYRAKTFVDTFVYRGGDALSGSAHSLLKSVGDLGPVGIAWVGSALAAAWAAVAWWLARHDAKGRAAASLPARDSMAVTQAEAHRTSSPAGSPSP